MFARLKFWLVSGVVLLLLGGAAWLWLPLDEVSVDSIAEWVKPLREPWWGSLVSVLGVALATLFCMPITVQIVVLVVTFDTGLAFCVSLSGVVLSAWLGHGVGHLFFREMLGRTLSRRMPSIAHELQRPALRATLAIRWLPVAPFSVMNVLAGSAGIPVRYFLTGTLLGTAPIIAVTVWGSSGVLRALRQPQDSKLWLTLLGIAVAVAALLGLRHYLRRRAERGGEV